MEHNNIETEAHTFNAPQLLLAAMSDIRQGMVRIEAKMDDHIKNAASAGRVDGIETRVRTLETQSAGRQVLDRVAWGVIGALSLTNSGAVLYAVLKLVN